MTVDWHTDCHQPAPPTPRKSVMATIQEIAEEHGTTRWAVLSSSRVQRDVRARHKAIKVISERYPEMSSVRIGQLFRRDHSTVLYALGRTKTRKPSWMAKGAGYGVLEHHNEQVEGDGNGNAEQHDEGDAGTDHRAG